MSEPIARTNVITRSMGADVRLHEQCEEHGHKWFQIPGHPPGCRMCCVCVYEEDSVCHASGALCKCTPQITHAEVKRLLHVSHMELQMVHPDSYPAGPSSPEWSDADQSSDALDAYQSSDALDAGQSSADLFSWQLQHDGWA